MSKRQRQYFRGVGCILLIAAMLLGLCACAVRDGEKGFFFQYESYIAAARTSTIEVALSFFGSRQVVAAFETASALKFQGADGVKIATFRVEERDPVAQFHTCALIMTLSFEESGVVEETMLQASFPDGSSSAYPIGTWTFDVQDTPVSEELVNVWETPAASGDGAAFPYQYMLTNPEASFQYVQYGPDAFAETLAGNIALTGDAAVKLIRPRIAVEWNGEIYNVYGLCCYCGALDVTKEEILASRDAAA